MDSRRVTEGAQILREGFRGNCLWLESAEQRVEVELGVVANECLRERCRLDQKEPMVIGGSESLVDVMVQFVSRYNVEDRQLGDPLGVIERHTVADTPAAVM